MWHSLDELELAEHFLAMRHGEVPVVTVIRHRTYKYIFRVCVCVCVCVCWTWVVRASRLVTYRCLRITRSLVLSSAPVTCKCDVAEHIYAMKLK